MKKSFILQITTVIFAFFIICILGYWGKGYYYQTRITQVLQRDLTIYSFVKREELTLPFTPYKINNYVSGLKSINLHGCPYDFIQAFHDHITAWELLSLSLEKHHEELNISFVKSALTGDITSFLKTVLESSNLGGNEEIEQQVIVIRLSWEHVLKIARKYGYDK